jgi:hypothetical protein
MQHNVRHAEAYEIRTVMHDHSIMTTVPRHLIHESSTSTQYQKQ